MSPGKYFDSAFHSLKSIIVSELHSSPSQEFMRDEDCLKQCMRDLLQPATMAEGIFHRAFIYKYDRSSA